MYKRDQKQYKKKTETKQRGILCALGSKRVTAASKMPKEHIFYKNA